MEFLAAPDFLGTPGVGLMTFSGLMLASLVTALIGVFTGAAGGIVLLGLMATVMPPLALIPVHTVVMLGTGAARTVLMWRNVMRPALLPFIIGSIIGAAVGAKVFVALTTVWLEFILGATSATTAATAIRTGGAATDDACGNATTTESCSIASLTGDRAWSFVLAASLVGCSTGCAVCSGFGANLMLNFAIAALNACAVNFSGTP